MIDSISRSLISEGLFFEETTFPCGSDREFWHSTVVNKEGKAISGGFGKDRKTARKIAIAEYLERKKFREFSNLPREPENDWGFSIIPTACGFAAGFDATNTTLRSMSEATERWVMSKWIDEKFKIPQILETSLPELDPVSNFFRAQFDEVLFFKKEVLLPVGSNLLRIEVAQTMGIKDSGIFPGSSAQTTGGNIWQHALLESYRHLLVVRNNPDIGGKFPDNKVRFFAKNAKLALEQINAADREDWPTPKIKFHRLQECDGGNYYIARTILDGWTSWSEGPLERFLY